MRRPVDRYEFVTCSVENCRTKIVARDANSRVSYSFLYLSTFLRKRRPLYPKILFAVKNGEDRRPQSPNSVQFDRDTRDRIRGKHIPRQGSLDGVPYGYSCGIQARYNHVAVTSEFSKSAIGVPAITPLPMWGQRALLSEDIPHSILGFQIFPSSDWSEDPRRRLPSRFPPRREQGITLMYFSF